MKIYHNTRCRKSRETLDLIKAHNVKPEVIEYLKEPLNEAQLKEILEKLNMSAKDIIRKGERIFKDEFKGKDLSEAQWVKAIADNPILMERPIVVKGNKAILGRPPENVKNLF